MPGARRPAPLARGCAAVLLCCALLLPQPAAARPEGPAPSAARRGDPAAAASRRIDPGALAAARRFLCPHGGAPVRGGRGRCRGGAGPAIAGGPDMLLPPGWWSGGLAAPSRRQAPCPAGTLPVPALARDDALRCLPQ